MKSARPLFKSRVFGPVLWAIVASSLSAGPVQAAGFPDASARAGSRAQRPAAAEQPGDPAADHRFRPAGPLSAERLVLIQQSGRTVLAAKHSAAPNPEMEAARQHLKAVSAELTHVFRNGSLVKPTLRTRERLRVEGKPAAAVSVRASVPATVRRLVPGGELGTFVEEAQEPLEVRVPMTDADPLSAEPAHSGEGWRRDVGALQLRLNGARDAFSALVAQRRRSNAAPADPVESGAGTLAAVQGALDAEDTARLAALRERLKPRTLPEERERQRRLAGLPAQTQPSPTLTTLTKHR
ncbi:hypothetical protein [Methyloversatilis sp.]|uniref:hypothetical protein n=1 Tax=Methyloversatilis sp. TaxID=2569862 RepID=UPI0035AE8244